MLLSMSSRKRRSTHGFVVSLRPPAGSGSRSSVKPMPFSKSHQGLMPQCQSLLRPSRSCQLKPSDSDLSNSRIPNLHNLPKFLNPSLGHSRQVTSSHSIYELHRRRSSAYRHLLKTHRVAYDFDAAKNAAEISRWRLRRNTSAVGVAPQKQSGLKRAKSLFPGQQATASLYAIDHWSRTGLDHVAARWEGLPLTSLEDVGEVPEGGSGPASGVPGEFGTDKDDEDIKEDPWYKNPKKIFKILLPHFMLLIILLTYTALGAGILILLEAETELDSRRHKINRLRSLYDKIANDTWALRFRKDVTRKQWDSNLEATLKNISKEHEGESFDFLEQDPLSSRWTFPAAVLYTLTVLTTCGYDHVGPLTDAGKLFAVGFALIGIPLMFITAADIGKFLSEIMLRGWKRSKQVCAYLNSKVCRFCGLCSKFRQKRKNSSTRSSGANSLSDATGSQYENPEMFEFGDGVEDDEETMSEGLWFPIGAYVSLICLYCALGALLYTSWESGWSFVRAFHFSFNLITTVGLGNIVVRDFVYLVLIVAYVIIGLAVVTMCVDLASTHLKAYFTKIHYFGRARSRFLGMSEDIREMMGLIAAMRKKKGGGKVTWDDVQRYLKYEQSLMLRPFTPKQLHMWRYIDETSSAFSGTIPRYASYASDLYSASSGRARHNHHPFHPQHSRHPSSRRTSSRRRLAGHSSISSGTGPTRLGSAHRLPPSLPPSGLRQERIIAEDLANNNILRPAGSPGVDINGLVRGGDGGSATSRPPSLHYSHSPSPMPAHRSQRSSMASTAPPSDVPQDEEMGTCLRPPGFKFRNRSPLLSPHDASAGKGVSPPRLDQLAPSSSNLHRDGSKRSSLSRDSRRSGHSNISSNSNHQHCPLPPISGLVPSPYEPAKATTQPQDPSSYLTLQLTVATREPQVDIDYLHPDGQTHSTDRLRAGSMTQGYQRTPSHPHSLTPETSPRLTSPHPPNGNISAS